MLVTAKEAESSSEGIGVSASSLRLRFLSGYASNDCRRVFNVEFRREGPMDEERDSSPRTGGVVYGGGSEFAP